MPGLGRGAPGTAGAGRPIPVLEEYGLLPGLGPAGRPMPVLEEKGLLPGRGPAGRGPPGVAGATPSADAAGAAGASGAGGATGVGATGAAAGGGTTGASTAVSSTGSALGAAFFAAVFLAGLSAAAGAGGIASRRRLATGASTVDDADFTNSPISASLARTSLLVTPSSLASSWTRTFDTSLLSWSGHTYPDRQCRRCMFMLACSWGVHPRITPDPLGG